MKLYELTNEFLSLENMASDISDELDATAFSELWESINLQFEEKAEKTACVIKNLLADAEALKAEENRLNLRRKRIEKSAESLKEYLEFNMIASDNKKITGKLFTLAIQKNQPSVVIDDESKLPDSCFIVKREVSKTAVKEYLTTGNADGAHLEQSESLRIK